MIVRVLDESICLELSADVVVPKFGSFNGTVQGLIQLSDTGTIVAHELCIGRIDLHED